MRVGLENEITIAATWWARQLERPPRMNNGDRRQTAMLSTQAVRTALYKPTPPAQEREFQATLTRLLLREAHRQIAARNEVQIFLEVDYGPGPMLAEAAEAAKLSDLEYRFPVKTLMVIEPGRVTVSEGYQAPDKLLYQASQLARPTTNRCE